VVLLASLRDELFYSESHPAKFDNAALDHLDAIFNLLLVRSSASNLNRLSILPTLLIL
jgi:hypothetical protein